MYVMMLFSNETQNLLFIKETPLENSVTVLTFSVKNQKTNF